MEQRSSEAQTLSMLIISVFRFMGVLRAHGSSLTMQSGQSPARWQVLGGLRGRQLTAADIARQMGLTRQSVQRLLNLLVEDSLVVKRPNPRHKRSPLFELTAVGTSTLKMIDVNQVAWSNQVAKGMDLDALETTLKTLDQLNVNLEASLDEVSERFGSQTSERSLRPASPMNQRRSRRSATKV